MQDLPFMEQLLDTELGLLRELQYARCMATDYAFVVTWRESNVNRAREALRDAAAQASARGLRARIAHRVRDVEGMNLMFAERYHQGAVAEAAAWQDRVYRLESELSLCRFEIDRELVALGVVSERVTALRREATRPAHVVEYVDVDAFVLEDARRGGRSWPATRQAGGADYGVRWSLEVEGRAIASTLWRISWLCDGFSVPPTFEVYAQESRSFHEERRGRVWLIGRITRPSDPSGRDDPMGQIMTRVSQDARFGRNSLIAAIAAITPHLD